MSKNERTADAEADPVAERERSGTEIEDPPPRPERTGRDGGSGDYRGRIVSRLTGPAFGVLGFLFANFAPFLGVAPLGAALLAGTDRYLFWIWLGDLAAALCGAGTSLGTPGALGERILPAVGVTLVLAIRLGIRLLFDRDAELEKDVPGPSSVGARADGAEESAGEKDRKNSLRTSGLRRLFSDGRGHTPARELSELWSPALFWQLLAAAFALFLPGVCRWGWDGFRFYDLAGLLLGTLTAPIATLLFAAWFEGGRWGGAVARLGRTSLLTALIAALYHPQKWLALTSVFVAVTGTTAAGTTVAGMTIGAGAILVAGRIAAVSVSVFALHRLARGAHGNLLGGAINAFAFALVTVPAWSPGFLLLFLLDVWIGRYRTVGNPRAGSYAGAWLAALGGWFWNAVTGTTGSYFYLLPGIFLGTLLFSVTEVRGDLPAAMPIGDARDGEIEGAIPPTFCLADGARAAGAMHDALGELSDIFYQLSDRMERQSRETEERGGTGGFAVSVGLHALVRCEKIRVAAADYAAMAEIAGMDRASPPEEYKSDPEAADRVARRLSPLGITPRGVAVWGTRCPTVFLDGVSADSLPVPTEEVTRVLSGVIGTRFASPVARRPDGLSGRADADGNGLLWRARHRVGIRFAGKSLARARDIPCGDSMTRFETDGGLSYAFLCDGMGSGSEAAFTAGVCTVMLEKLLSAGIALPTALRMVNHFLRAKSGGSVDECSTTLDLFGVDLYTGQARFVKSGAAVSYVVRGDTLFRIRARTLPLGILPGLDFGEIPFGLADGDTVILLSDGVSDATEDGTEGIQSSDGITVAGQGGTRLSWFENLLLHGLPAEPAAAVDTILRATVPTRSEEDEMIAWDRETDGEADGGNEPADEDDDDRTVMVLHVRIHG